MAVRKEGRKIRGRKKSKRTSSNKRDFLQNYSVSQLRDVAVSFTREEARSPSITRKNRASSLKRKLCVELQSLRRKTNSQQLQTGGQALTSRQLNPLAFWRVVHTACSASQRKGSGSVLFFLSPRDILPLSLWQFPKFYRFPV